MSLTSTSNWEGLSPGDKVKVSGLRGVFIYQSYATNERGDEWVNVYGGTPNRERARSFHPNRIKHLSGDPVLA